MLARVLNATQMPPSLKTQYTLFSLRRPNSAKHLKLRIAHLGPKSSCPWLIQRGIHAWAGHRTNLPTRDCSKTLSVNEAPEGRSYGRIDFRSFDNDGMRVRFG